VFLFELFGPSTNHLEGFFSFVLVLVILVGVDQGKISGFQGLLLPFFVNQGTLAFDYISYET
jgi:hypothetical protein